MNDENENENTTPFFHIHVFVFPLSLFSVEGGTYCWLMVISCRDISIQLFHQRVGQSEGELAIFNGS